jgi:AcrR family transcriptional regulator
LTTAGEPLDAGEHVTDRPATSKEHLDGSTRDQIIAAALRILAREGFRGLTARAIAADAGTNLALVNYYFGSKRNLLLQLDAALDAVKLDRQRAMYAEQHLPLSAKWRRAVEFYRQDLSDGFIRINHELYMLGYADPAMAEQARARLGRWRALLEEIAAEALPALGIDLPPALVASAVVSFWTGMEVQHLDGTPEAEGHLFAILDFVGDWLELREQLLATGTAVSTRALVSDDDGT